MKVRVQSVDERINSLIAEYEERDAEMQRLLEEKLAELEKQKGESNEP